MKTIEVQIDDKTMERIACVTEKYGISASGLITAVLRHANWDKMLNNPILGSTRDQADLEDEILEEIMNERARRWVD